MLYMRKFAVQKMSLYRKMQYQNSINKQNNGRNRWEMVADCINPAFSDNTLPLLHLKPSYFIQWRHDMSCTFCTSTKYDMDSEINGFHSLHFRPLLTRQLVPVTKPAREPIPLHCAQLQHK